MKIVRFAWGGQALFGILEKNLIYSVEGDVFGKFLKGSHHISVEGVRILPPVCPSKVVTMGANYHTYSITGGKPTNSLKVPSTIVGPEDSVVYPVGVTELIMEAELAIVIGRMAKNITSAQAADYILGYTVANDFTARDVARKDGRHTRAKNYDGFCPVGPVIETELDPSNLAIRGKINGQVKQDGSTGHMITHVPEVVSQYSHVMTLMPGDIILTSTPTEPPYVHVGDVVEAEIEGIGTLRNYIVAPS
jgi:2-keto-4-pentenoate hydratase/2-oxohepta-3-ene-1,7-dioic acid hydratase in catechol pathway